jgi:hypothetical protein
MIRSTPPRRGWWHPRATTSGCTRRRHQRAMSPRSLSTTSARLGLQCPRATPQWRRCRIDRGGARTRVRIRDRSRRRPRRGAQCGWEEAASANERQRFLDRCPDHPSDLTWRDAQGNLHARHRHVREPRRAGAWTRGGRCRHLPLAILAGPNGNAVTGAAPDSSVGAVIESTDGTRTTVPSRIPNCCSPSRILSISWPSVHGSLRRDWVGVLV